MRYPDQSLRPVAHLTVLVARLLLDLFRFVGLLLRPSHSVAAENLFLRQQLALYQAREVKPRRADPARRIVLTLLSKLFDWRGALVIVRPETLLRWHRQGFRLFWRCKSALGRPPLPNQLRALIREIAWANPTWGQERIANELRLKLGIRVSPRTVRKYLPADPKPGHHGWARSQRWTPFVRNPAAAIVACDFCVAVTVTFRVLYVFIVIEHASRRILGCNVTAHPTAQWTLQQLREAIPSDHAYRFLLHDRDCIFSQRLDESIANLRLEVLKSPVRTPTANAICERALGSLRRECLDFLIPLTENHLRLMLKAWVQHYHEGRPHMALGPGIPDPPSGLPASLQIHRHRIPNPLRVIAHPILGGLHHEYCLERKAA